MNEIERRIESKSKRLTKKNIIYIRVDDETLGKLSSLQEKLGIKNRSELVRVLLEDHIENIGKLPAPEDKAG